MIQMAKKLRGRERQRLQKKIEEAKQRGGVSASLFLEEEMNALADADCFFFSGPRLCPKGLLTVFFPDEEHAELTVAEFVPGKGRATKLFLSALRECGRVGVKQVHTVCDPAYGFSVEKIAGVRFSYAWSEYMLSIGMCELAAAGNGREEGKIQLRRDTAPEGDGTLCYRLFCDGREAAECRILPLQNGALCYLFGLKTEEAFRRRGMATALLAGIARDYTDKEGSILQLQVSSANVPAERLYRKLGFRTEEQRDYYKTEGAANGEE